jgi:outer membrane protein assembly factor BamD
MSHSSRSRLVVATSLLAVIVLPACRGGVKNPQNDPVLSLSAIESLAEGKRLLAAEKYSQSRKYLAHAFEIEPNSVAGREALLLVADSLFHQAGSDNFIQAETKYRDFLNRFPTSDRAAYVQYQIGAALAGRVERPDRDQTVTLRALGAFEDLLRLYPASEQAEQARQRIAELRARLAEHEFQVARFYYRYGLPNATVKRLEYLLANYPEYSAKDKVYYYIGSSLDRMKKPEEARQWFDKLRQEFPASEFVAEIPSAVDRG